MPLNDHTIAGGAGFSVPRAAGSSPSVGSPPRGAVVVLSLSILCAFAMAIGVSSRSSAPANDTASTSPMMGRAASPTPPRAEALKELSIPFEANAGQFDDRVAFRAQTFAGAVFVTRRGEIVHMLRGVDEQHARSFNAVPAAGLRAVDAMEDPTASMSAWAVVETLAGAAPLSPVGEEANATRVDRIRGSDFQRWTSSASTYRSVSLGMPWPGVTSSLRAHANNVEKIFTVSAGADVSSIALQINGADHLRVDDRGALVADTGRGVVRFDAPIAYQIEGAQRHDVRVAYRLIDARRYGFSVGEHAADTALVIDPSLQSSFLGSSGNDLATSVAVDAGGDVYVAGNVGYSDFPGTSGGAQAASGGDQDVFVAKLSGDLQHFIQTTYLGGAGDDSVSSIAIGAAGDVYVGGSTESADFPGTAGAAQSAYAGNGDMFVARLSGDLHTLVRSTYLGAADSNSDGASAVALDAAGDVYVAGNTRSAAFPGVAGGAQSQFGGFGINGAGDGVVSKLSADLNTLVQSSYYGGSGDDSLSSLAVNPTGMVYIAGNTSSANLLHTADGFQPALNGPSDGYVALLAGDLRSFAHATYLGGSYLDSVARLAISADGDIYVGGFTYSTDFPYTFGGAYPWHAPLDNGAADAFVLALSGDLHTPINATYLGGNSLDLMRGMALDHEGNVIVAGGTLSTDFPGTGLAVQPAHAFDGPVYDGFVAKLRGDLRYLLQATYLGGAGTDLVNAVAVGPNDEIYAVGYTFTQDFPFVAGGAQSTHAGMPGAGDSDGFVTRLPANLSDRLFANGFD